MSRLFPVMLALFTLTLFAPWATAVEGTLSERRLGDTASPYGFVEYLPKGYALPANAGKRYPLWVFLSGAGERGNGTTDLWEGATRHGPAGDIRNNGADYPLVILSPQSDNWFEYEHSKLDQFVEYAKATYHIDPDRVVFSGLCSGSSGVLGYAQRHPQQLAAIFPAVCQSAVGNAPAVAQVPAWLFHSFGDPAVSRNLSIRWADALANELYPYRAPENGVSLDLISSAYVSLGQPAALAFMQPKQAWSVSMWLKRKAPNATGAILAKGNFSAATRSFYLQSPGGTGLTLEVGGVTTVNNFGVVNDTNWHHVALINRDAGGGVFKSHMVIDGFNVSGETACGSALGDGFDITMGARRSSSNSDSANLFNGKLDEVTFWNRALNDDEVKVVWSRPANWIGSASLPGLAAWYRCGDAGDSGTQLKDSAGSAHGTLSGWCGFDNLDVVKWSLVGWGDSLTQGVGGSSSYLLRAPLRDGRSVVHQGVGGQVSAQVRARFEASPGSRRAINLLWAGRNDVTNDNGSILANLQAMVAALPSDGRYVVLSIVNKRDGLEDPGSAKYNKIVSVNQSLADAFGRNYLDIRALLIAAAGPGDAADVAADRLPTSLTIADGLHLNDAGYDVVNRAVLQKIGALGWNNSNAMRTYPNGLTNGVPDASKYAAVDQTSVFRPECGWTWLNGVSPRTNSALMFTLYSNDDHGSWTYTNRNPTVLHWAFAQRRQSPFGGSPTSLPGVLEAERFDFGGLGRGFNEVSAANTGDSTFRAEVNPFDGTTDLSPVGLSSGGSGVFLTGTEASEWLNYTVQVNAAGTPNLSCSVAAVTAGGRFHLELGGAPITGAINVPVTASATTFTTVNVGPVTLPAGRNVLRLVIDRGGFNLDQLSFVNPVVPPPPVAITDVILDNSTAGVLSTTGTWTPATSPAGFQGADFLSAAAANAATATFRPTLDTAGLYTVSLRQPRAADRGVALVTVAYANGGSTFSTRIDQSLYGNDWYPIGTFAFTAGTAGAVTIGNAGATGPIGVDGVRFTAVAAMPLLDRIVDNIDRGRVTTTGPWQVSSFQAGFYGTNYLSAVPGVTASATFRPCPDHAGYFKVFAQYPSNSSRGIAQIRIQHGDGTQVDNTTIDQAQNGGVWNYLGTYAFPQGEAGSVTLTAPASPKYINADAIRFTEVAMPSGGG